MTFPLQITFRHIPPSRIFENRIRELARRLEKFSAKVENCHVVIEKPHQSSAHGSLFDVHITITVPGSAIVIGRAHASDPKHADAYIALRDAFNAAKRRLQEYERIGRGEIKAHAAAPREAATEAAAASA